jgi:hypothetical protein
MIIVPNIVLVVVILITSHTCRLKGRHGHGGGSGSSECSSLSTPGSSVNGSPSASVSAATAFGSVATIGSQVSKAWTRSDIAAIPRCLRSSVVSVDA